MRSQPQKAAPADATRTVLHHNDNDGDTDEKQSSPRLTIEIKIHGLVRELTWAERRLPGKTDSVTDLTSLTDDEVFERLDCVSIAALCRHGKAAELASDAIRPILIAAARQ